MDLRTVFTESTDTLLDRAVDNGRAFMFNFSHADLASGGGTIIFRFTTFDMPIFLLSTVFKSSEPRAEFMTFLNPVVSNITTEDLIAPVWLNMAIGHSRPPLITCHKLAGATLTGGTVIAEDMAGPPKMSARRVLPLNTEFYVMLRNTGGNNAHNAVEVVAMELEQGLYA